MSEHEMDQQYIEALRGKYASDHKLSRELWRAALYHRFAPEENAEIIAAFNRLETRIDEFEAEIWFGTAGLRDKIAASRANGRLYLLDKYHNEHIVISPLGFVDIQIVNTVTGEGINLGISMKQTPETKLRQHMGLMNIHATLEGALELLQIATEKAPGI